MKKLTVVFLFMIMMFSMAGCNNRSMNHIIQNEPSITGAVVTISGLIPDFLYNRCPHCKKLLGRNEADFCQHCGGKID